MFEVVRTRFGPDQLESDIIKFIDDFDEMIRYVRRFNTVFGRNGMDMIMTYRERGTPYIRSVDPDGYPRFLLEKRNTTV